MQIHQAQAQRIIEAIRQVLLINNRIGKLNARQAPDDQDPRVIFTMDDVSDKKREYRASLLDTGPDTMEVCLETYNGNKLEYCEFVSYGKNETERAARRIRLHINGVKHNDTLDALYERMKEESKKYPNIKTIMLDVNSPGFKRGDFSITSDLFVGTNAGESKSNITLHLMAKLVAAGKKFVFQHNHDFI